MIYIFIGPPASGKGTQAKLLAQEINVPFVSIGALLRQKAQSDPKLEEAIHQGQFAPQQMIQEIVDTVHDLRYPTIVIDGIIRNREQATNVITHWKPAEITVFLLEIPDAEIIKRASKRLEDGHKRADDTLDVVQRRIDGYRQSLKLIRDELLDKKIRLIEIDGSGSIEDVHQTIMSYL